METKKNHFTLSELLTVIMLIMLLTALLLPAAMRARGKAAQVDCLSNLRQLGLAFLMYSHDYRGRLPPYITGGGIYQHPGTNWARYTWPYYQNLMLLDCAASPQSGPVDDSVSALHLYDGNYGWNYDGTQGNNGPLHAHIDAPARGYLLCDSGDPCLIYGANHWDNLMEELDLDWNSRAEGANRHLDKVNVLLVDGHSEQLTLTNFLAVPCPNYASPWYIEWENGILSGGIIPFPRR